MSQPSGSVLVVDDNREVLTAIRLLLKDHVEAVHTTTDPAALPALLADTSYDVILLDMNFTQGASSGQEGFLWLERILRADPAVVVIMMTAYGDVEKAVHAMKTGATDFVVKPWHNEKLIATVRTALKLRQSRREVSHQPAPPTPQDEHGAPSFAMIGSSPAMKHLFATIKKVATTEANVLILGEHGTGKELVARSLHHHSTRAAQAFVSVDLGALSENLFESELFGHLKGAFTGATQDRPGRFETASGGTLFLDEIGNIPLSLQRKLLTVLERRAVTRVGSMDVIPIDIRLISATNLPIYEMAQKDPLSGGPLGFRADLLYRINTVEIPLPPLRERLADIPRLAKYYLKVHARKYRKPAWRISAEAMERLVAYHWPGNVRELKHTLERAVIMSETETLEPVDFLFSAPQRPPQEVAFSQENLALEEIERAAIRKALSTYGGNISRAAEELGLTRRSLYRRIEKYGL